MAPKRRPARPGLSYYDANHDRLITVTEEVSGWKRRIEDRWPRLQIYFDTWDEVWCVVDTDDRGEQYLVINPPTKYMDQRLYDRIAKADRNIDDSDPADLVDEHNAKIERDIDRRFEDQVGEFGQRLIHALKKDGYMDHPDVFGLRSKPHESRRALNRR